MQCVVPSPKFTCYLEFGYIHRVRAKMHSTRQLFLSYLLLNFIDFFYHRVDFVSAGDEFGVGVSTSLDAIEPVENSASSKLSVVSGVSNSIIETVKNAITASCKYSKSPKPLTFYTALDEVCLLNRTKKSFEVTILNPVTVATMTGGSLGHDIYEFNNYQFYWHNAPCNATHHLEARVYYRNLKYDSFDVALDYPDGVVVVNFPIATNSDFPNSKFDHFSNVLQEKLKGPGCHAKIKSSFTYTWFVSFPHGSVYHTYRAKYTDTETGKIATVKVMDLPMDPRVNYISWEQFQSTFGSMTDLLEHVNNLKPEKGDNPPERSQGIHVMYLHA
ncbi:uncharacterized protein LOC135837041 [Planococcus citri]|uniref:uncharacterized protein LOC135837041 n=1 Tax=Planococcus citri TaxID=170843 RepID=UPI0031F82FF5